MADEAPAPKLLDPRTVRRNNEVTIDLLDGTCVRARREDMTMLIFEGRLPMPMLTAVQKMIEMPGATPEERVSALGSEHGKALIDLLREHACRVVMAPILTMTDDGNPDHLPVQLLDSAKLMLIWNATSVVPTVAGTPLTPQLAATFRPPVPEHPVDVPSNGTGLPPSAKHVVTADVELITG